MIEKKYKKNYLDGKILSISNYVQVLKEISNVIKKYRKDNCLTQQEMAKILEVNQAMISKLEKGKYNPSIKFLIELWNSLDTPECNLGCEMLNKMSIVIKEGYDIKYTNKKYEKIFRLYTSKINKNEFREIGKQYTSSNFDMEISEDNNYEFALAL